MTTTTAIQRFTKGYTLRITSTDRGQLREADAWLDEQLLELVAWAERRYAVNVSLDETR